MKPTKSETRQEKIDRLIAEERIRLISDTEHQARFICFGDSDMHSVIFNKRNDRWICACDGEAFVGKNYDNCTHADACKKFYELHKIKQIGDENVNYPDF